MNTEATTQISLLEKTDVIQRLGISERTLENMMNARKFPRGLKLGKRIVWAGRVVEDWLARELTYQLQWEPPQRRRKSGKTE
jgi:prophage regulatory protein